MDLADDLKTKSNFLKVWHLHSLFTSSSNRTGKKKTALLRWNKISEEYLIGRSVVGLRIFAVVISE